MKIPFLAQLLQRSQSVSGALIVAVSRFDHYEFLLGIDLDLVVTGEKDVDLRWGCFYVVEWSGSHNGDDTFLLEAVV